MTDEKQEERERALAFVLADSERLTGISIEADKNRVPAIEALENCIPVPRADYERMQTSHSAVGMAAMGNIELIPRTELEALRADAERGRRALWQIMQWSGWPDDAFTLNPQYLVLLGRAGLLKIGSRTWTPAAHAFAAEMEKGDVTK